MAARLVFQPVAVLAIWTLLVLVLLAFKRIGGGIRGRVRASDFRLGESPSVPEDVVVVNRNFMNLLEVPVLFYLACLVAVLTGRGDHTFVVAAWVFVGLRLVHSLVHLTINRIRYRLTTFAAANFVLLFLWLRLARALFQ